MSFGGFFGSNSSGGSANNPYNNNTNMLTSSISQPQMITSPPIAQPMSNSPALSLALVCLTLSLFSLPICVYVCIYFCVIVEF